MPGSDLSGTWAIPRALRWFAWSRSSLVLCRSSAGLQHHRSLTLPSTSAISHYLQRDLVRPALHLLCLDPETSSSIFIYFSLDIFIYLVRDLVCPAHLILELCQCGWVLFTCSSLASFSSLTGSLSISWSLWITCTCTMHLLLALAAAFSFFGNHSTCTEETRTEIQSASSCQVVLPSKRNATIDLPAADPSVFYAGQAPFEGFLPLSPRFVQPCQVQRRNHGDARFVWGWTNAPPCIVVPANCAGTNASTCTMSMGSPRRRRPTRIGRIPAGRNSIRGGP